MISVGIIGTAGFAATHLNAIRTFSSDHKLALHVACEVNSRYREELSKLAGKGVRTYTDVEEMFKAEQGKLDLIIIPTSILSHKPLAISSMKNGFNVLLEKPPTPTLQDIDAIINTSLETGQFCAIGFQSVYSNSFNKIRDIISTNELGKLISISGKMSWQRDSQYYSRNNWAGKTRIGNDWIIDGSISNPGAHYLNNMLLLGDADSKESSHIEVNAELYRANKDIECEDTTCVRVKLANGVTVNYYTTLCGGNHKTPLLILKFECGEINWEVGSKLIVKRTGDENHFSNITNYDAECVQHSIYENIANHIEHGTEIMCDIQRSRLFTLAVNAAYESSQTISSIPPEFCTVKIDTDGVKTTEINDINASIDEALEKEALFSECAIPWSKKSEPFTTNHYNSFPEKFNLQTAD